MTIISLRENELVPLLNIYSCLYSRVRACIAWYVCMLAALPIAAMRLSMIASPYASSHARIQKVLSEGVQIVFFFLLLIKGCKYHYKRDIIVPPVKRY